MGCGGCGLWMDPTLSLCHTLSWGVVILLLEWQSTVKKSVRSIRASCDQFLTGSLATACVLFWFKVHEVFSPVHVTSVVNIEQFNEEVHTFIVLIVQERSIGKNINYKLKTMLLYSASTFLMLLHCISALPRDKTTEAPDMPLMNNQKIRRPTHISEFTDPDTGLNPFLDLEEGLTSIGRNVMEDERRDDQPYFDLDPVEGDAPDRKWNIQEPKEALGRIPGRQPELDYKDENDFQTVMTPRIFPSPLTTVALSTSKDLENVKANAVDADRESKFDIEKEEKESSTFSQSTVIYATVAISIMTVIIVLAGACWWRRKLKLSRTSTTVESGEVKS